MRKNVGTPEGESETLLTGQTGPRPAPELEREPAPASRRPPRRPLLGRLRRFPLFLLLGYYVLLIAVDTALVAYVPAVRQAFVEPEVLGSIAADGAALLEGTRVVGVEAPGEPTLRMALERALVTLLVILGALSLVFPVAWVYMRTKRFRYDPALVRSVIILPIVVAGIALVVKNSLALAFSLAGIVAAVRFRNTLKDPRDAVYIFLVIGIGLSAGVQALDVALVMSLLFNLVVLLLWRYNVGSIYSGRYARTGILSVGDPSLLAAQSPEEQNELRRRVLDAGGTKKADGILLVHSSEPELARRTVQEAMSEMTRQWRLMEIAEGAGEVSTLEYLVRLKKKVAPPELLGALDERWSAQIAAAEYVPFRKRKGKRKGKKGAILADEENGSE